MAVFTGYNFYIMKNFSLIVVGILFIYCVSSCRKQVDKGFEMTVDLSISNPYLPMSVLVDTIESVRLQLPSPYFWGMVDNVISKDSCYYISDRKQEMAFRFSKNGTFLNAIVQRGEGPGEYREMDSFFVGKDCVYVCDMSKRTIYSYSFDGKFLHSLSFPYSLVFNDVVELPDGRFLCHRPSQSENCKGLWILDQKGRRVKNLLEYEKGTPCKNSYWNTLCAQEDGTIKIYNPVDGSYYQYDAVNDTVVRTMRQKSNLPMLADFHCSDRELYETKEECTYSLFTVDGKNLVFSLWSFNSANKGMWSVYFKKDGRIEQGNLTKMDIPGYSEMGRPVSSNIPNTFVTVYTDEFPDDAFPSAYQQQEINEQTAILSLLRLK